MTDHKELLARLDANSDFGIARDAAAAIRGLLAQERYTETVERDYANCKLTLNDERYCHYQTIAQLKNAASEEIKTVERRLRKVEDELKQMMSDKDSLSDYGDPGLIKVVTYEEALRWKLLEAQQEIENKEQI